VLEYDKVYGDTLAKGDVIFEDGAYHELMHLREDDEGMLDFISYNLTTGEHDDTVLVDPDGLYALYRSE
jgi:hypothetical protein